MIWAAVDVMDGQCVQLRRGDPTTARFKRDAIQAARHWESEGAHGLHLVDLDAAMGQGSNVALLRETMQTLQRPVQVGGGVRDAARIGEWITAGAERVILGTRAIREPDWLAAMAERFPGRLVLALDAHDGEVTTSGWSEGSGVRAIDVARDVDRLGLAALLYTNVGIEGSLEGLDPTPIHDLCQAVETPVLVSGGITTADDVKTAYRLGASGVVVGTALYAETVRMDELVAISEDGGAHL